MINMKNLNLDFNSQITDEGIKHMIYIKNLSLYENNKITNNGIFKMY